MLELLAASITVLAENLEAEPAGVLRDITALIEERD